MRYERYLHLSSTLLILTGFYAILIAGSYVIPVTIGMIVTGIYWHFGERLPKLLQVPKFVWNGIAILYFFYLIFDTFFPGGSEDLIGNGVKFVVYLQVVKLLSPKTNRDQLQIYLLSFLHILASTVMTSSLAFAFPFLVYIVLATWTLAMFNMKVQLEEATREERQKSAVRSLLRSKDIVTVKYLGATSILSLSIIAFTMLVFFSFPRLSMGNFIKRAQVSRRVSGFSEKVELGTIGTIKTNDKIALRVEISKETLKNIDPESLYWRGSAADFFDGYSWERSAKGKWRIRMSTEDHVISFERPKYPGGKLINYRVFMESLNPPVLFGADQLQRIVWESTTIDRLFKGSLSLEQDAYLGLYFRGSSLFASDLSYQAESIVGDPDPAILRKEVESFPYYIRDRYLQLPALNPKVEDLLRNIQVDESSLYNKIISIMTFIERRSRYTLDVQDVGVRDPLKHFLIDRRMGHCEYFSTALAVALRLHDIPARHTVGFRGGEVNEYGSYLAIRQSHAHSWVEVLFPKAGWIRFDPSPLDSTVNPSLSRFRKVYQFVDYLRLRWNKYIIDYDLRAQATYVEKFGRQVMRLFQKSKLKGSSTRGEGDQTRGGGKRRGFDSWLFPTMLILIVLGFGTFAFLRRKRRGGVAGKYREILRLLSSKGFHKEFFETAEELTTRVEKEWGPLPALRALTEMYYDERFGERACEIARWEKELMNLKGILSTRKRAPRRRAA